MSIQQAALYSLLGISVVFATLSILMVIVQIFYNLTTPKEEAPAPAAAPAPEAPGSAGGVKLYNTDPRDAAMVMAIVADSLGKPLNELRFISIKEIGEKEQ
ncbi:MAG: OadG family protein [Clostridia bacterium]|nr:OadG family protein [Clostridia bacterium]